jgi:hypothetical protein
VSAQSEWRRSGVFSVGRASESVGTNSGSSFAPSVRDGLELGLHHGLHLIVAVTACGGAVYLHSVKKLRRRRHAIRRERWQTSKKLVVLLAVRQWHCLAW